MDPRARLVELAGTSDGRSLAEAALCIAAEAHPGLVVPAWLGRLDALGWRAAERITPDLDLDAAVGAISQLLFDEEGLRGNAEDYYDPRNSFLNEVLDRRLGIPITLSVVFIAVAARAGLDARGVGLPGHFIVRAARGGGSRLLDPFHGGRLLDARGCAALVARQHPGAGWDSRWIEPVTTRQILVRMLGNLKVAHVARGEWTAALAAVDRIRLLSPELAGERRDRGDLLARLGHRAAAISEWAAYLREVPGAPDAARVRERLRALRQEIASHN